MIQASLWYFFLHPPNLDCVGPLWMSFVMTYWNPHKGGQLSKSSYISFVGQLDKTKWNSKSGIFLILTPSSFNQLHESPSQPCPVPDCAQRGSQSCTIFPSNNTQQRYNRRANPIGQFTWSFPHTSLRDSLQGLQNTFLHPHHLMACNLHLAHRPRTVSGWTQHWPTAISIHPATPSTAQHVRDGSTWHQEGEKFELFDPG